MKTRVPSKPIVLLLLISLLSAFSLGQKTKLDLAGMDKSVNPGDDFFSYANGGWVKKTEIPPEKTSLGNFDLIADEVSKRTASLITEAAKTKTPEGKLVGDYFSSFMDEAAIEKRGLDPVKPELAAIAAISDKTSLSSVLGSELRADVDPLNNTNFQTDNIFGLFISADFNEPTKNVPYLLQGGLSLPVRETYLADDKESAELRDKFKAHIAAILKLASIGDADAKAARIFDLERKIAAVQATREESSDVHKANNPWKMADFATKAPGLDWNAYFKSAGIADAPMIMVWHPKPTTGISALVASEPLDVWKDYLTFHRIDRVAGLLPKAFADENFAFYRRTLYGVTKQSPRSARAVNNTSNALGDVVAKMYVKKYFPPKAKTDIQTVVQNIVAAFGKRIDALDWMSPQTKAKAKAKLGTLYVGVGYPDTWRSYAGVKLAPDNVLGNIDTLDKVDYQWSLAKLKKPVDKKEWWLGAQTVNALNLPLQNALNFPAAILNPPFFDQNADPVENYGSIGAVIGHEISHSFDDTGSQFDAEGKLLNWWLPADYDHFTASGGRLAAEFDKYEPLPGLHINGKQTLGENIADVAGLAAAYDAYRAFYGGKQAPSAGALTGDQRFFLAFGQSWRGKMRPETLKVVVLTDGHSPEEFRADTVRNIDAWYDAFNIKPGTKLYLDPKDRVKVW